jgi:diguanylate cyclase (GGDEF)-like protein
LYSARVSTSASSPKEKATRIDLLRALEVLDSLTDAELGTVAESSRWLSLEGGQLLFGAEGTGTDSPSAVRNGGGRLYVVREGEVLITRRGEEGRDITLATFVAGEGFGELDLFGPSAAEAGITARCEEDTSLLVFPDPAGGRPAEQFFADHPAIAAKVLNGLLAMVAGRIRSTNRLLAEKSHWVQELRRQVSVDKLTGLYNAGFLEEDLQRMIDAQASRVCLLMLKPDNFKSVNDTYGHQAGDRVLQLMAEELRARLADRGTAVRYRGDVLSAVLPACTLAEARRMGETVRAAMQGLDLREISAGDPLSITVSVGAAGTSPSARKTAAMLVERAYENLFSARNAGGDRVCAAAPRGARDGMPTQRAGRR